MKNKPLTIAIVRRTENMLPAETEHTNILLPVGNKYPCAWLNEGTDKEEFIILIDGTFHTAQNIDFEY